MTTQEAIVHFGSRRKLADALGILPVAVLKWGTYPPELRQWQLEDMTGGTLRRERKAVGA